ncbi:MAG: D,D-heptose 1,7-bisphosphate phosphatase [Planctomycetota bacterium]|nr:MAG: D,D-heptose 1,7-bisphosphate phosphatase [Planctomycetota bacterium]
MSVEPRVAGRRYNSSMPHELHPAVFLDRDNTLIADPGYISDPADVRLLPGAAEAVRRIRAAGYRAVVVTNQSGVARGRITEAQLEAVHLRLRALLRGERAELDAIYVCPYLDGPEAVVAAYRRDSDLRKPRPGMLLLAARELGLDLPHSWMIGDSPRDVEAGRAAGCRTILISAEARPLPPGMPPPDQVARDLAAAVGYIIAQGV